MRSIFLILPLLAIACNVIAQEKVNPVVEEHGGIYPVPEATVLPDADIDYKIVIDVASGPLKPNQKNPALNNVARMLNLHAVGGVPADKMEVVLAIHAGATYALLNNEAYQKRYEVDNPNLTLIDALEEAGVLFAVCGQSLKSRGIDPGEVNSQVKIATSMLTTITTYQLKGYAFLKF